MKKEILIKIGELFENVNEIKPIIHHITNYVTVNDCANIVLAIGASPIMADDIDEVQDIVSISSALVLNIGTLNKRTIESMICAGKKANTLNIPVILDPVGAGASQLRNIVTERLLKEVKLSVLRGNMSEIRFAAGLQSSTKGVDASDSDMKNGTKSGIKIASELAEKLGCTVAITGVVDIISDGSRTVTIENGTKLLSNVTGTGCMCTSLIGSYCGAASDYFIAAAAGILSMGIAGELAAENSENIGNGSYHTAIIDAVSRLKPETLFGRAKLHEA